MNAMNADKSRRHQAGADDGAELHLSWTERDLPAGRHQFHRERLMTQIHEMRQNDTTAANTTAANTTAANTAAAATVTHAQSKRESRRFRLPRPAIMLPAMAAAVAGAVVAGTVMAGSEGVRDAGRSSGGVATGPVLTTQIGTATEKGVPELLDRLSLAAAKNTTPRSVRPDQFVYIESKYAESYTLMDHGKTTLASHALSRRQVWKSPDGTKGWLIDPFATDDPKGMTLSGPDENGNTPKDGLGGPSYNYLSKLTTDPDKLLAKIYKETKGQGNTPDQQAFTTIGDMLTESYPPAELSAALFKAAKKIPGVVVVADAVDAIGRHGVAVARLDETGERDEWIFDRKTGLLLGERSVQARGNNGVITRGTVISTRAITNRAVVDEMKQTPGQSS
ncbi:CU044_5270 family protein [Streptomyces sp. YIM S03343]